MSEAINTNSDGTVTGRSVNKKEKLFPVLKGVKCEINGLCMAQVASSIEELLSNGTLGFDDNTPICSQHITATEVKIEEIYTWRISQGAFVCDVVVSVPFEKQPGFPIEYAFQFSLGVSVDNWTDFEMSNVVPYTGTFAEHLGVQLDSYGLPVFHREDIPQASVDIWDEWCSEALTDSALRQPMILAEQMKLRVEKRKLHGCGDQPYILFFETDTVLVDQEKRAGDRKAPPPLEESFQGRTIVINMNYPQKDDGDLSIYMACFQYHWHYIFYWIQGKRTTDKRAFLMEKEKDDGKEMKKNPLYFLWTKIGGMELMLPRHILDEKVRTDTPKALQKKPDLGYTLHSGYIHQNLASLIAADYSLKPFRAKQRLIETGRVAAKGALNWDPEMKSYVPAYALSDCYNPKSKDETFFVNRWTLEKLYQENEELRKTLMTGNFVHVDGLVCFNDPAFVTAQYSGTQRIPKLTAWANAHVDECCLLFQKSYPDDESRAVFDYRPDWNDNRIEQCLKLRLKTSKEELEEEKNKYLKLIPATFSEALEFLMLNNPWRRLNALTLAEQSCISRENISFYLRGNNVLPSFSDLISLSIGMGLPSWISIPFIRKMGIEIEREGLLGIWGRLLDCYCLLSVKEALKYVNLHCKTQQDDNGKDGTRAVLFFRQPKGE